MVCGLSVVVLAHLEGSSAAVEADHIVYGWLFFSLVSVILIAIGTSFAQKPDRSVPIGLASYANAPIWRFATAILAAILLASAGPAYAARLNALYPAPPTPRADPPAIDARWHIVPDTNADWRPAVSGADAQFLDAAQGPGSGIVIRYVALYHLRATGNLLTMTENRLVDNQRWHIARYGHGEIFWDGKRTKVATAEIVSGPHRRLVWSFYAVAGNITSGLMETKLL